MIDQKVLILADISGYTKFMKLYTVSVAHAEAIINELVLSLINSVASPLVVNKLEGDAVLIYAEIDTVNKVEEVAKSALDTLSQLYTNFENKKKELIGKNICICDACNTMKNLDLKVIMHSGKATLTNIGQFKELSGLDVVIVHRLLKNSIDSHRYVLLTNPAQNIVNEVDEIQHLEPETFHEQYDVGSIDGYVYRVDNKFLNYIKATIKEQQPLGIIKKIVVGTIQICKFDIQLIKKLLGVNRTKYKNIPY